MSLEKAKNIYSVLQKNSLITNCERKEIGFHNYFHLIGDYILASEKQNLSILEIGSFKGYSAIFFASYKKVKHIDCVDIFQFTDQEKEFNHNIGNFSSKIKAHKTLSSEFVPEKKYDMIFIDGSHAYQDVINDFKKFDKYLLPGGYIFFDDYNDSKYSPEVKMAIDDMLKNNTINPFVYIIIGSPKNIAKAYSFHDNDTMENSNLFIIKRKY